MKNETKLFTFKHDNGDVFTYEDAKHAYKLNGVELPGTTTPLKLVNELSWDADGKMTDKSQIIQQWAIKMVSNEIIEQTKGKKDLTGEQVEKIVIEAKKAPNKKFTGAGISGTEIHAEIEQRIKCAIKENNGVITWDSSMSFAITQQAKNFVDWATKNNVRFLFSEEPIYSKEWMNCGTVDFICEIDGKVLVGDIKTNGDKRRYEWNTKTNSYDFTKPVSDIHIPALWQCGAYGKMCTESEARKLIDKFDGVVIVNIKKSGEFDEKLDVKYDYNVESLVTAYDLVLRLYKQFRNKYN
jgi:ribosomal protein L17